MTIELLSHVFTHVVAFAYAWAIALTTLMIASHILKCLHSLKESRKRRKYQQQRQALWDTDYWTLKRLKLAYDIPTESMKKVDLIQGILAHQFA